MEKINTNSSLFSDFPVQNDQKIAQNPTPLNQQDSNSNTTNEVINTIGANPSSLGLIDLWNEVIENKQATEEKLKGIVENVFDETFPNNSNYPAHFLIEVISRTDRTGFPNKSAYSANLLIGVISHVNITPNLVNYIIIGVGSHLHLFSAIDQKAILEAIIKFMKVTPDSNSVYQTLKTQAWTGEFNWESELSNNASQGSSCTLL